MSSIIRAPKITNQTRILNVKRSVKDHLHEDLVVGVETNAIDNLEDTLLSPGLEQDTSGVENSGELPLYNDIDDEFQPIPKAYYSDEVHTNLNTTKNELIETREELESLKKDISDKKLEAEKNGFEKGYESGLAQGSEDLQQKIESLAQVCDLLKIELADFVTKHEDILVEIAFAAVTKILGDKLISREGVIDAIKHAAGKIVSTESVKIHVSTDDYELINSGDVGLDYFLSNDQIQIVADDRVKLGGCIVESKRGSLDARLDVQLNTLVDTLLQVRSSRS